MAKREFHVDVDLSNNDLTNVDSIALNTSTVDAGGIGKIWWSTSNETANIGLDAAVTLQVGQEHLIRVKNSSGTVAIPEMSVVMFAGATGDTVTVAPAITDGTYPAEYIVGITTESIPADGFGFVTQFGFVNNVDTDTPAWNAGTILYPDPNTPGALTATEPTAPAIKMRIAAVTRRHAQSGRILVRTVYSPELRGNNDVQIDSPVDNNVIVYDSATTSWKNKDFGYPTFIQSSQPVTDFDKYLWWDTSESSLTLWIEDGV